MEFNGIPFLITFFLSSSGGLFWYQFEHHYAAKPDLTFVRMVIYSLIGGVISVLVFGMVYNWIL